MSERAVDETGRVRFRPVTPGPDMSLRQRQRHDICNTCGRLQIDPRRHAGGYGTEIDLERPDRRKGHQGMDTPALQRDGRSGSGAQAVADQGYRTVSFCDLFDNVASRVPAGKLLHPPAQAGTQPEQMMDIFADRPLGVEAADENDGALPR